MQDPLSSPRPGRVPREAYITPKTSYFDTYPNGATGSSASLPKLKMKRSQAGPSLKASSSAVAVGSSTKENEGREDALEKKEKEVKHRSSMGRLRDRFRSPKSPDLSTMPPTAAATAVAAAAAGSSSPANDATPRPRTASSHRPVGLDSPSSDTAPDPTASPSSSRRVKYRQPTTRPSSSRSSSTRSSPVVPLYPFPSSAHTTPTAHGKLDRPGLASANSSASSIFDLFAGPRTSVHFDAETGDILTHAPAASVMDALASTLRDSALPPEVRNMKREMGGRGRDRELRRMERELDEARKRARRKEKEAAAANGATPRKEFGLGLLAENGVPDLSLAIRPAPPTPSAFSFSDKSSSSGHRGSVKSSLTGSRSDGTFETSRSWQSGSKRDTMVSNSSSLPDFFPSASPSSMRLSASLPPSTAPTPSPPPSAKLEPIRIPTIQEIIERHSPSPSQPPPAPKVPPKDAPPPTEKSVPSIDEIVRSYAPLLRQVQKEAEEKEAEGKKAKATAAPTRASEASAVRPSFDSVADEVMGYLEAFNGLEERKRTLSGVRSLPKLRLGSIAESEASSSFTADRRRAYGRQEPPNADQELAQYLRSPKLTTLLKLQRSTNSAITVSLADVGSPKGHPVIVFLGLGCVRYLVALYDELAEALGLRLICIDRWGLGKTSDIADNRRGFLEWSAIVEEVADQLCLDTFSLLAHSAGAPYALATSLRLDHRIKGSIHLLAPFVSTTAEGGLNAGGYKWLKYVPNAMIRTAQAAEWKVQGWRLGKPPALNLEPVGFDVNAPVGSGVLLPDAEDGAETEDQLGPASEAAWGLWVDLQPRLRKVSAMSEWSHLSKESSRTAHLPTASTSPKAFFSKVLAGRKGMTRSVSSASSSTCTSPPSAPMSPSPTSPRPSMTPTLESRSSGQSSLPPKPPHGSLGKTATKRMSANSLLSDRPSTLESYSTRPTSPSSLSHSLPALGPPASATPKGDLGVALLRASYAESLRGGTADLLAILERNDRPWGFSYADVKGHVKVWHGDRDDRISLSCARWMESAMASCEVKVVHGADHSLMTNVKIMMEVLESISDDAKAP